MDQNTHLLLVDDDREIRALVSQFLGKHGYDVTAAADAKEMDQALARGSFDLAILDLMLPGEDGLSICRRLRAETRLPIIMLTAMGEETDRIVGLEMGADDYLAKPFNPRELLARIKAVLRRSTALPDEDTASIRYCFDGWELDAGRRTLADPQGALVELTAGEFDLLMAFLDRPKRVLNRDQLLDITRGRMASPFDRSIDVQLSRLRKKVEADQKNPVMIKTIRGGGYMLTAEVIRL